MRFHTVLPAIAIGSILTGCGASQDEGGDVAPAIRREVTLRVLNFNYLDARVFAMSAGYRERLGTVDSGGDRAFTLEWPYADLQVEISLISVPSTFTEPMPVFPGDTIQLEVQQSPGTSPIVRRVR